MKTIYYTDDDILVIQLSDQPVRREISQSWNVHLSYGDGDELVEMVILEAGKNGLFPILTQRHAA